ncbi:MAG: hypothetical protein KC766_27105 [Myxococcales bacterium]|nr:hypothetical protein [Myxococcales bacterium]
MAWSRPALGALVALGLVACGSDTQRESGSGGSASAGSAGQSSGGSGGDAGEHSGGSAGSSSGGNAGTSGGGSGSTLLPGCFKAPSPDPVIKYGDFLTDATWNDPHVLKQSDGSYVMYASASSGFADPIIVSIYRLTSADARSWSLDPQTPVFEPAGAMESVETPSVVWFKGKYHLFITTYPDQGDAFGYHLAHAVSDDGIAFSLENERFVVPTGNANDFDGLIVGEPAAVVVGDELYVYFTAVGVDAGTMQSRQVIGLVTSMDGSTFSAPALALTPDPILYPRGDGYIGFSTPFAALIDGHVQLFSDVANDKHDDYYDADWLQVALQLSVSVDGRSNFTQYPDPIFERGDFSWTKREIRSVAVLEDTDRVRMWFSGDEIVTRDGAGNLSFQPEVWGIGYAECLR